MDDLEVYAEIQLDKRFRFNGELRERRGSHYLRLSSLVESTGFFPSEILEDDEFLLENGQYKTVRNGESVDVPTLAFSFKESFLKEYAPHVLEDVIGEEIVFSVFLRTKG
jgi:hypothetical protein